MTRGKSVGGLAPETQREFNVAKLTFKPPHEEKTTADKFMRHLLELYKESNK